MAKTRIAMLITCVALLGSAVFNAQEPSRRQARLPSVEADITKYHKVGGRVVSSTGRYYRAADGRVLEDVGSNGRIIDLRTQTVTFLDHESRSARVVAVPAVPSPRSSSSLQSRVAAGVHEGRRLTKLRSLGPSGEKIEIWTVDELGLIVLQRSESTTSVHTQILRNVVVREQDTSRFAVPLTYTVSPIALSGFADPDTLGRRHLLDPLAREGRSANPSAVR